MGASSQTPSQKQVVDKLMKKVGEETKSTPRRNDPSTRRDVTFLIYNCPREHLCSVKGVFKFEKGAGYSNPFNHLRRCLAGGSKEKLLRMYYATEDEKRRNPVLSSPPTMSTTCRERAMYAYLRLIVLHSLPLSFVEEKEVRDFSKFDVVFSEKTLKRVLLELVQIVQNAIAEELKGTTGAIMYDGWTECGTYYLGIIAVYMRTVLVTRFGKPQKTEELAMPLLSVSPIAAAIREDDDGRETFRESDKFDAESHIRQFEDVFHLYKQNVHDWCKVQLADNCNMNMMIAEIMDVPHVSCLSHKLNFDINDMLSPDSRLSSILDEIHNTMSDCRRKLRNRTMLRRLIDLSPVTPNESRWTGQFKMLSRYNKIHSDLIRAVNDANASIRINMSDGFKLQALRFEEVLKYFNLVTLHLKKHGATLADCRVSVDTLVSMVNTKKHEPGHALFQCTFKPDRVSLTGNHSPNHVFESGIIKIQTGKAGTLTDAEKKACKLFEISSLTPTHGDETESEDDSLHELQRAINRNKKRRVEGKASRYINADFVLGSTAEMETVWSIAKDLLPGYREEIEPVVFEAMLFLKVNQEYWNMKSVQTAMKHCSEEDSRR